MTSNRNPDENAADKDDLRGKFRGKTRGRGIVEF